jgi:hypothetical protein
MLKRIYVLFLFIYCISCSSTDDKIRVFIPDTTLPFEKCISLKRKPVNLSITGNSNCCEKFTLVVTDCHDNYTTELNFTDRQDQFLIDWYIDEVKINFYAETCDSCSLMVYIKY